MLKGNRNKMRRIGSRVFHALILIAVLVFASDSFASLQVGDGQFGEETSMQTSANPKESSQSHSTETGFPCSTGHHCPQHHCQMLPAQGALAAPLDSASLQGIEDRRAPSAPFLERVPRPPSA